jgi:adenylate cyclase
LRPKSFEVLRYLVENAGRLVSKDEIVKAIWPNVIVTDESLTRCVSDVRLALGAAARRIIKTVPRRGYLFDALVSFAVEGAGTVIPATSSKTTVAPRLSIVLPFANLGGGKEQDYFVDALTEMLTSGDAIIDEEPILLPAEDRAG